MTTDPEHPLLTWLEGKHAPRNWQEWAALYSPRFFHTHMLVTDLRQGVLPRRWNGVLPSQERPYDH